MISSSRRRLLKAAALFLPAACLSPQWLIAAENVLSGENKEGSVFSANDHHVLKTLYSAVFPDVTADHLAEEGHVFIRLIDACMSEAQHMRVQTYLEQIGKENMVGLKEKILLSFEQPSNHEQALMALRQYALVVYTTSQRFVFEVDHYNPAPKYYRSVKILR